ncbi:MAG: sterol desaturase family protein [Flavobacteriales bacterium]|nr:sterol desaturase family protein [Flavobacteriales bacterium]
MISLLLFLGAFVVMEGVAWFTHKYIMHGFLWQLHRDHHRPEPGFFEKNDAFFLIFALPSMFLIMWGTWFGGTWHLFAGLGILAYGICYFLVHDVLIHQRFKWFRNTNNTYLLALRRAHKIHHKHLGKEEGECFGMLLVPRKYFTFAKKQEQA